MINCDLDGLFFYTTVPPPPGCGLVGQLMLAPGLGFEFEIWEEKNWENWNDISNKPIHCIY